MFRYLAPVAFAPVALAACASGGGSTAGTPAAAPRPTAAPDVPAPRAGAFAYRPKGPRRYAFERVDSLLLEYQGGTSQAQAFDRTAYLTVATTAGADGYRIAVTLDSLRAPETTGLSADSLRAAEGTMWVATLGVDGKLSPFQPSRVTMAGAQVESALRSLFPRLPAAGARAGETWADTSVATVKATAFDVQEQAVTTYRATDGEGRGDARTLRLESSATFQQQGRGEQFGQALDLAATGTRQSVHVLAQDGSLVRAEGSDSSAMTITVPAVGQTVPARQRGSYRITLLSGASR